MLADFLSATDDRPVVLALYSHQIHHLIMKRQPAPGN
jgi:hypothetical protein